jgi:hypothetical protein
MQVLKTRYNPATGEHSNPVILRVHGDLDPTVQAIAKSNSYLTPLAVFMALVKREKVYTTFSCYQHIGEGPLTPR